MLSLYADDLVVFVAPTEADFVIVKAIMDTFVEVSVLRTNVNKYQLTLIRYTDEQIMVVQ
jgi:hypothetical protein